MRQAFKNFIEGMKKDERGMTLVELLAVIVILAIVGAIAFVSIGNVIENSRQDAQISNALQGISAGKLYEASNGEITGPVILSEEDGYLEEAMDPWNNDVLLTVVVDRNDEGELEVIVSGSGDCNIDASESVLRSDDLDRDTICTTGPAAYPAG